jgi:hypothetical protein
MGKRSVVDRLAHGKPPDLSQRNVVAEWDHGTAPVVRGWLFLLVCVGLAFAIATVGADSFLIPAGYVPPTVAVLALQAARRAYSAVGDDWIYTRRAVIGGGTYSNLRSLTGVEVRRRYGRDLLFLRDSENHRHVFDVRVTGPTPFGRTLAALLAQSGAKIDFRAANILATWRT